MAWVQVGFKLCCNMKETPPIQGVSVWVLWGFDGGRCCQGGVFFNGVYDC